MHRTRFIPAFAWSAILLASLRQPAGAQTLPTWSISDRPRVSIGLSAVELYGVDGAAPLPGGRLAVAERGNSRISVFTASGQLLRMIGRRGAGPREFGLLYSILTRADTILAYDTQYNRVSLWLADGTFVKSIPLRSYGHEFTELRGAASATMLVLTAREPAPERRAGLQRNTLTLLVLHPSGELQPVVRGGQWEYSYSYADAQGATQYRIPFLTRTQVTAVLGKAIYVPMDSAFIVTLDLNNHSRRVLPLPIKQRVFDRRVVADYRNGLLKQVARGGPSAKRISAVFGDGFPAPQYAPPVADLRLIGENVWIQETPTPGARASLWYVFNPRTETLVGQAVVPIGWRVLGGTSEALYVLHRDPMDVEYIGVHAVRRN